MAEERFAMDVIAQAKRKCRYYRKMLLISMMANVVLASAVLVAVILK